MLQTKQQAVLDGFRHVFFTELTETPSLCAISLYVRPSSCESRNASRVFPFSPSSMLSTSCRVSSWLSRSSGEGATPLRHKRQHLQIRFFQRVSAKQVHHHAFGDSAQERARIADRRERFAAHYPQKVSSGNVICIKGRLEFARQPTFQPAVMGAIKRLER